MFTGLVEEIGTIQELDVKPGSVEFTIACTTVLEDLALGDSIAVEGVCLTATSKDSSGFKTTATPETLARTTLGALAKGSKVNLERSVTLQTRLGGHLVQGHVDGTASAMSVATEGDSQRWTFSLSSELAPYVIYKGSIAINGVSLTVASLNSDSFTVALIPKTIELTTFQYLQPGDKVNLETDLIGKYVNRFMETASFRR